MPVAWLWAAGGVVGALVLLLAGLAAVGSALPRGHVATRRLTVSRAPADVWAVVADLGGQITWRARLKGASKVSDPSDCDGRVGEVWREVLGRHALDLKTLEAVPPTPEHPGRLVRELVTPGLPFSGRWEYEVGPAPGGLGGSVVTVTERGEVANPLVRAAHRLLVGPKATVNAYLRDLARRLGEPARPW